MEAITSYILSLSCGAILCSIILSISGTDGAGGSLRRMICGLFMAFLAISPLKDVNLEKFYQEMESYSDEADAAAQWGIAQAEGATAAIIKDQCEAYILDKAGELGMEVEVYVSLDAQSRLPVAVSLTCSATPYQKQVLTDYIRETLGIERSQQQWTN